MKYKSILKKISLKRLKNKFKNISKKIEYVKRYNIHDKYQIHDIDESTYKTLVKYEQFLRYKNFLISLITIYIICYGTLLNFIFYIFSTYELSLMNIAGFGLAWYFLSEEILPRIKATIR
jgi:endonuclease III-like uncharacterized protein